MADRLYCANCLQMASGPVPCCEAFDPPCVTKAVAESARDMLINREISMTDPTTRDPAASLARAMQLARDARSGLIETHWAESACVAFVRDDAPALLAEVQKLRAARDVGADLDNEDRRDDPGFWWNVAAFRGIELTRQVELAEAAEAKREAAEQVAREACWLLDATQQPGGISSDRVTDFLAHHGARTGESNG